jgi:hypothetical protein
VLTLFGDSLPFFEKNALLLSQTFLLGDDRIAVLLLMKFIALVPFISKKYGSIYPKPCFTAKCSPEGLGVEMSFP